jgi:hypothetical protein
MGDARVVRPPDRQAGWVGIFIGLAGVALGEGLKRI